MTGKIWLFSYLCSSLTSFIKGNRYCISITINITIIELNDIQQEKNPFSIRKQQLLRKGTPLARYHKMMLIMNNMRHPDAD
jgi:hypothetical protein